MKIAYLVSKYPAPSHTFIEREILELEKLGLTIDRFSVRPATPAEALGEIANQEAGRTRSLVRFQPVAYLVAFISTLITAPGRSAAVFQQALNVPGAAQKLKWMAYFAEAVLLAWWIRRDGASHLHCHFGNAGSNTAWLAAKLAAVPLSVTFHGIDLDEPDKFRHREKLDDVVFAVCISDAGRRILLRSAPNCEAKIHVVRCGYPVPAKLTAAPRDRQIICVARLSPEKGHSILISALGGLNEEGADFRCLLVGSGPLEASIRAMIDGAGLTDKVILCGALAPKDVYRHVAESDISVLASWGEGIPLVLLEAFAQGRPVVATDVGGIPEIVKDGVTGRLVPAGDVRALKEAISELLDHPLDAEKMGMAGRKIVMMQHDPVLSAQMMRQLFEG